MYSDDGRSNLKNSRSCRWAYIRVRLVLKIETSSRRQHGTGSSRSWNDNKGTACPRGAIMRRTDLSGASARCPAKVSHPLRGMALGTLAEIAVRLVISGYIFAVVVYVNASSNWDKDDDLGTWILWQSRATYPCPSCPESHVVYPSNHGLRVQIFPTLCLKGVPASYHFLDATEGRNC